jgi:hypothetical protein
MRTLAIVFAGIAIGGCGASAVGDTQPAAHGASPEHLTCSYAVSYSSLAQLRRGSSSVVVITPTGAQSVRRLAGVPYTVAKVRVVEPVAGKRLPRTFELRQIGRPGVGGCGPLVSSTDTYLAFVAAARLRRGGLPAHDQFVVVGGTQGLFGRPAGGSPDHGSFTRQFAEPGSRLPLKVSVAQARGST